MMDLDEENGGWVPLDSVLDGGPAARAAIGLIVLANDTVIEPEVRRFLPLPGVEVYSSRIPMARDVSPECLAAMAGELPRAVELLIPEHRLDVVAFGCTSGSMIIGPERIAGIVEKVRPGVKVCNPVSASLAAFATLGVRRIGLITPYSTEVNKRVERFFVSPLVRASFRTATFPSPAFARRTYCEPQSISAGGTWKLCSSPARRCAAPASSTRWKRRSASRW
ncbi:hypothetical protein [Sinorhizobium meliloti]|uniref:maleate cis-trans isomerase family protein n=1 Tax=Rhizobium meliloti TaxID=382 RepID=UPI001F4078CC|nr:hypothetical protein [Sinorhizobium meliloti]